MCVCVCVCVIKLEGHFMSAYFILDPFKFSYDSFDFCMELILEDGMCYSSALIKHVWKRNLYVIYMH